jgi:hypothetical protein
MREVLDREELHGRFVDELRRHPDAAGSEFVFEIDDRLDEAGGCNWYPLAAIELWRGDLMRNLATFREVRDRLAARYNVLTSADAHPVEEPAPA